MAEIVGQMLARSDNDVAEMLARHVARAEGLEPTFAGGGRAVGAVLARVGVPTAGSCSPTAAVCPARTESRP